MDHCNSSGELCQTLFETPLHQLRDELHSIPTEMMKLETIALAEQFDLHEYHRESARNFLRKESIVTAICAGGIDRGMRLLLNSDDPEGCE